MTNKSHPSLPAHDVWLDYLKIFAAFLVVLQHSISGTWTTYGPDTATWKVTNFFFILSRSAVVLFFMCSGAGILKRPHSMEEVFKKNILQLLKAYLCWMLIYGLFDSISLIQEGLGSFATIANAFMKCILFGKYHTWFIFALIGLYLITPFLDTLIESRQKMRYFLLLSLFFSVIVPILASIPFLERISSNLANFRMQFVTGYILYYVAGYYLTRIEWKPLYSVIAFFTLIASYSFALLYSTHISILLDSPRQEIYDEFGACGFLIAVSIFSLFRGLTHLKESRAASRLLKLGIGIYLLHPLLLPFFDGFVGLQRLLMAFILYAISVSLCFFISKNRLLRNLLLKS